MRAGRRVLEDRPRKITSFRHALLPLPHATAFATHGVLGIASCMFYFCSRLHDALAGRPASFSAGTMTLTQAAQLAVVSNASVSLMVAAPTLLRAMARLGVRLRRVIRRRLKPARTGSARTRKGP